MLPHVIRVIDLVQLAPCDKKPDRNVLLKTAAVVNEAFVDCGYLVVINHGIPEELDATLH